MIETPKTVYSQTMKKKKSLSKTPVYKQKKENSTIEKQNVIEIKEKAIKAEKKVD